MKPSQVLILVLMAFSALAMIFVFTHGVNVATWRPVFHNSEPDEYIVDGPRFSDRLACFTEAARLNETTAGGAWSCALVRR